MKVLVIGSGGREHALVWLTSRSSEVKEVISAPGNGGISTIARCLSVDIKDVKEVVKLAVKEKVDFVIVGPEDPLARGIVNELERQKIPAFGPKIMGAQLEASKVFSKKFMKEFGIPTADFKVFENPVAAMKHVEEKGAPIVIKAEGLAAGKGVKVAETVEEAGEAISDLMVKKKFGKAGERVVVEDYIEGEELSFIAIISGDKMLPLLPSQDHKRVYDGDQGPNTGGMGAYAPTPFVNEGLRDKIIKKIFEPVIKGLKDKGIEYRGALYAGLMITKGEVYVLEFNVRFGDPEMQPIALLIKNDMVPVLYKASTGELKNEDVIEWEEGYSICVVLTSGGYPGEYKKGFEIKGIEDAEREGAMVFHAGTELKSGKFYTAGGRVLGVTYRAKTMNEAVEGVYRCIEKIQWEGIHYRKDIGRRALRYSS